MRGTTRERRGPRVHGAACRVAAGAPPPRGPLAGVPNGVDLHAPPRGLNACACAPATKVRCACGSTCLMRVNCSADAGIAKCPLVCNPARSADRRRAACARAAEARGAAAVGLAAPCGGRRTKRVLRWPCDRVLEVVQAAAASRACIGNGRRCHARGCVVHGACGVKCTRVAVANAARCALRHTCACARSVVGPTPAARRAPTHAPQSTVRSERRAVSWWQPSAGGRLPCLL
jgi:hypothetical protein